MPSSNRIGRTSTVNDVIRDYPATASIFNFFGIDTCCGGRLTIAEAADNESVDPGVLVAALRNSARHSLPQPA